MKSPQPAAGFTLIEVMVSVAIIAIGLLGFQGFYGAAQSSLQRTTERIQANLAVQEIMEQIATDTAIGINPAAYAGDLKECSTAALVPKRRTWCERIAAIAGDAPSALPANETRNVGVQAIAGSTPQRYVVTVTLATQSGKNHIVQRRIVTAPPPP